MQYWTAGNASLRRADDIAMTTLVSSIGTTLIIQQQTLNSVTHRKWLLLPCSMELQACPKISRS